MPDLRHPTPHADVNAALHRFVTHLRAALGDHFRGMYLTGSLALGDFDPRTSDIDFIVLTDTHLSADLVEVVREVHGSFDASGSPWAGRVEAAYVPLEALHPNATSTVGYPQVEKGGPLFLAPLESGWIFHLYTLREYRVTVAGPDVRPWIESLDPDDMRRAAAPISELWLQEARNDPTWLDWLREQEHQAFVVLTLCRLLYTLATGSLASKPAAARWAEEALGPRWASLISRSLSKQHGRGQTPESEVAETVAMVEYTVDQFQRWKNSLPPTSHP